MSTLEVHLQHGEQGFTLDSSVRAGDVFDTETLVERAISELQGEFVTLLQNKLAEAVKEGRILDAKRLEHRLSRKNATPRPIVWSSTEHAGGQKITHRAEGALRNARVIEHPRSNHFELWVEEKRWLSGNYLKLGDLFALAETLLQAGL